ncbi:MAG: hypothetical protein BECKG1743E_GA0114224_112441, partial [Candidatus Kentron sp. G]
HERYPADVKCLSLLYLYVGRYPRNNASRNTSAAVITIWSTLSNCLRKSSILSLCCISDIVGILASSLKILDFFREIFAARSTSCPLKSGNHCLWGSCYVAMGEIRARRTGYTHLPCFRKWY